MTKTKRNINFLKKRHQQTGFDSDYIDKLSDSELAWLEQFARDYYDGDSNQANQEHKKEANKRRYRAKHCDSLNKISILQSTPEQVDDCDPEKILLLKELLKSTTT